MAKTANTADTLRPDEVAQIREILPYCRSIKLTVIIVGSILGLGGLGAFGCAWRYLDHSIVKPIDDLQSKVDGHATALATYSTMPEKLAGIETRATNSVNKCEERLAEIGKKFDKQIEQTAPLVALAPEIKDAATKFDETAKATNDALKKATTVAEDVTEIKQQVAEVKTKLKDLETVAANVKAASEAIAKVDTSIQQLNRSADPSRSVASATIRLPKSDKVKEDGRFRTTLYEIKMTELPPSVVGERFDGIQVDSFQLRATFPNVTLVTWECRVEPSDHKFLVLVSTIAEDAATVADVLSRPESQATLVISRPSP